MGRSLLALSTLVGGVGLGTAIAYVMLVVVAFLPGGEAIAEFMVGGEAAPSYGYALIVVPYVLLLLHLWLRVNLAAILLDRGDDELAEGFASRRLKVGLLRSKREGLANRAALMRLACRTGDYDRAEELAEGAKLPRRGVFGAISVEAAFHRWRLEALLRRENLVRARQVVAEAWPMAGRGPEIAEFCACAAELAVRNNDAEDYRVWRERSRFAAADVERMAVVEAFAALRFEEPGGDAWADRLDPQILRWTEDVPGAALEVATVREALADHGEDATEAWQDAADTRSIHVWEKRHQ